MKSLLLFVLLLFTPEQDTVFQDSVYLTAPVHPLLEQGGYPVDEDSTIFIFHGIGPYEIEERAARLNQKLKDLNEVQLDINPLKVEYGKEVNDILLRGELLFSVNDADAQSLSLSRRGATNYYLERFREKFTEDDPVFSNILFVNIAVAILIILAFIFGLKYYNRLFRLISFKLQKQKGGLFNGFSVKGYELLTSDKQLLIIKGVLSVFKYALLLFIIYLLLPALFALFPWTQGIAEQLIGYILDPLKELGLSVVNYLPNLLFIIVIIVILRYFLRVLDFFKEEIKHERLLIPGFYPEWARPTYNIVRTIFIALGFIGVWPLLPMSNSDIFKGVSTFFGLLIALGGAGAFSNIIAGLVITYMRSFKIGDRVKIGEVIGDVKEKALLNTKVKTIKNEIITIPNSQMLNSHTINYTTANDEEGLILHTTVTIGYDVPWRDVHKLLVDAALATEFVKKKPHPFVLQTSLDDFYVSYQLNARTREIQKMAVIYSELHKNIQDKFNEAGIEIMSPHYGAQRDGNQSTIPQKYLPKDYQAPWFRIKSEE